MLITPQGLCSARLLIPYWEMYGSWEIKDFQEAVSGFTTSEPSAISCVWGERQDWHTHPGTDGWRWPSWVHCCPKPFPALCTWAMLNLVFSGADRLSEVIEVGADTWRFVHGCWKWSIYTLHKVHMLHTKGELSDLRSTLDLSWTPQLHVCNILPPSVRNELSCLWGFLQSYPSGIKSIGIDRKQICASRDKCFPPC